MADVEPVSSTGPPEAVRAKLAELAAAVEAECPTPAQKMLRWLGALGAFMARPRGTAALIEAQGRAFSASLRAITAGLDQRCVCEHTRDEHSRSLADGPCLECPCPAWMPPPTGGAEGEGRPRPGGGRT